MIGLVDLQASILLRFLTDGKMGHCLLNPLSRRSPHISMSILISFDHWYVLALRCISYPIFLAQRMTVLGWPNIIYLFKIVEPQCGKGNLASCSWMFCVIGRYYYTGSTCYFVNTWLVRIVAIFWTRGPAVWREVMPSSMPVVSNVTLTGNKAWK